MHAHVYVNILSLNMNKMPTGLYGQLSIRRIYYFCISTALYRIKVLKYWKPGFNVRHQESDIHRLGGFYYVHDPLNFYHRPYHDHNGVTYVHPNAYALFVASQTYVSGYNWDFVVHIAFKKNITKSTGKKWTSWIFLR